MGIGIDFDGIADEFDGQKGSELHHAGGASMLGHFHSASTWRPGSFPRNPFYSKIRSLVQVEKP